MSQRLLLDTHLLLWAALFPERLPAKAKKLIDEAGNTLYFSTASVWEMSIKLARARKDLEIDIRQWRAGLLANGYQELEITSTHAMGVRDLPDIHKDPFDRLLLAQAMREDLTLVTADELLATYPGPILKV